MLKKPHCDSVGESLEFLLQFQRFQLCGTGCMSEAWTALQDQAAVQGIWHRLSVVLGAAGRITPPLLLHPHPLPSANLPSTETPKERWKQTCLRVLTLFRSNHWHWHFGKPLSGSDGFEIHNAAMYPSFFSTPLSLSLFLPERGSGQECLLERQMRIERLTVQTIGKRDRGWNRVPPPSSSSSQLPPLLNYVWSL